MPKLHLIKTNIDAIGKKDKTPSPQSGQILYWDDRLPGFGLRVTPTGKVFIVQGRIRGADIRMKIGAADRMTAEEARSEAKKLLGQIEAGTDPRQRKDDRADQSRTLKTVFDDYMSDKKLKPKTSHVYNAAFRLVLSDWSNRTLDEITGDDALKRYDEACKGWRAVHDAKHKRGNGDALASQAMRLLGQLYNFAIDVQNSNVRNPVRRLKHSRRGWSKSNQRQITILDSELPLFYQCITGLRYQKTQDYVMLVLLTGLRQQEAAGLEWREVNLSESYLIIRGERTKNGINHQLPLPKYLKAMLSRRSDENQKIGSPYVFPGDGKTGHYVEPKMAFVDASKKLGKRIGSHALRHTFATVSQRLQINERLQSTLLNHTKPGVTTKYIHADIDMLRDPMTRINRHILDAMGVPDPEPDNSVVAIMAARNKKRKGG